MPASAWIMLFIGIFVLFGGLIYCIALAFFHTLKQTNKK